MVISFAAADRKAAFQAVIKDVQQEFPDYELQVIMDTDYGEE
ncbi:hypothetical protein [Selenomonas ruminantium]|nr:hypothetical protein [Selenomonas ruminantium]